MSAAPLSSFEVYIPQVAVLLADDSELRAFLKR